jgi:hypothetical protein
MRRLACLIAGAGLLAGVPAHAAVTLDFSGVESGAIQVGPVNVPIANGTYPSNPTRVSTGGTTKTVVQILSTEASFQSGVAVSGPKASAQSYSGVDALVANHSDGQVTISSITSTIIPAGLGFYVQNRQGDAVGGDPFTGFPQSATSTFSQFYGASLAGKTIATAGFTFDIYANNLESDPIYTLSGLLTLGFDTAGNVVQGGDIQVAGQSLDGFTTEVNTTHALAYKWDATDLTLPLNTLLEGGGTENLYYRASAFASTNVGCLSSAWSCIVAYSGFGDPIGRGGGVEAASRTFAGVLGAAGPNDPPDITNIHFDPQIITPFQLNLDSGGGDPSGAPEPALWLSMILGFGLMGAALRRRAEVAYS